MTLPSTTRLMIDYHVYPGQPLVSAAFIVQLFDSPEQAAQECIDRYGKGMGFCRAEGEAEIPGAGGQATKAVGCLLAYREHGSIDQVIEDLHAQWRRTVFPGNFGDRYEPGMERAKTIEPALREALAEWF